MEQAAELAGGSWGWLLAMALAAPLAGAGLLTAGRRRLPATVAGRMAVAAVAISFLAVATALGRYLASGPAGVELIRFWPGGGSSSSITVGLRGDGLSLWFALVVSGVGLLIHIYSIGYMAGDPGFVRYFAELNHFIFAMLLLVLADGLLGMLVGWAQVGLASYLLIGFWFERPDARAASMKAFLVTLAGEVGILLGAAALWGATGALRFDELFQRLDIVPQGRLVVVGLLLLWGAAAKSAQLPLHVWLPDAMAGPTPVSALIHAATMVTAGVYLMARMHPLYLAAPVAAAVVAWVGAASCLFGAVVACGQTDIKRVLAYSTMSQVGYMLLGVGLAAQPAGLFHFFTQAFFKALLFLAAGLVIHHLAGEQDLTRMRGLGRAVPLAYAATLVGALAMAGIPPFSGYYSKEAILEAAWSQGQVSLWALGTLSAGLTGFYTFRLVALAFSGPAAPRPPAPAGGHGDGGHRLTVGERRAMELPVIVLSVLALAAGWVWIPGRTAWVLEVLGPVFPAAAAAVDHHGPHPVPAAAAWLPVGLAVAGGLVAWHVYGPGRGAKATRWSAPPAVARAWGEGLYVDALYRRVVVAAVVRGAHWLAGAVEAGWIDGSVRGVGALVALASSLLGRLQPGPVRRYVFGVLAGSAVVAAWMVWSAWTPG